MRDLAFAAIWVVALPLSFMSASCGVLLWVWIAMLSPNELLYGFLGGVQFNKIVAVITLGIVVFNKEKKDFYLDSLLVLLVLFSISATVSWLGAIIPSDDGNELWQKLIKAVVLAFTISIVMTTRHRMHLLVLAIVISLAFLGVKEGLIAILTVGGHQITGSGAIGDNNSLATALEMMAPLAYYLSRYSAVRAVRLGMLAVMGLCIVTTVFTYSRGGFVGLVVMCLMMIKNSRNKLGGLVIVALVGGAIYGLAPAAWFQRLNTIEDAKEDGSFMGRVVAWKISYLIAGANPMFGGGPHAVQRGQNWTKFRPFIGTVGWIATPEPDIIPHAAHSSYFEVLGDLGYIGLALFLAILVMTFWKIWRIKRLSRGEPELQWAYDLANMLQISMVVYAVTTAALSMAYFELLYIVIALVSRCERTVRQTIAARTAADMPKPMKARVFEDVPRPGALRPGAVVRPLTVPSRVR